MTRAISRVGTCTLFLLLAVVNLRATGSVEKQDDDTAAAAKALQPLLQQVRTRMQSPGVAVTPGALPPSPFTGRSSAAVAVTVGRQPAKVDPKVLEAMDRLLAWDRTLVAGEETTTLFLRWLDQLKLKVTTVGPPDPRACDTACVVARLAKPDERFGKSRAERERTRDELLVFALSDALGDQDQ